ncbi:MAG: cadmium-translocating P-type ATPase [Gammaproteobacteria bacterium]|nr:cadmium-translocating P-type ATPase [Gammaproteobacteria bacterium]
MTPQAACFHCGEALPGGKPILASLGDDHQPVCCIGCKAVAEFIHSSGLEAFYQHRSRPSADLGLRAEPLEWRHYDDQDLLLRYVSDDGKNATTTIEIGGMYCSACVWLLDNAMLRLDAVESVSVSPATRRAVIRWDKSRLKFSQLLAAIAQVGFKPSPTSAGLASDEHDGESRQALKRLIVAAAAGMQVMMFAVALYAGDYYGIEAHIERFLRIISLFVCLPIVFYSARPFFAGAYRGIKARSPGMDLPVAIAIAAAFIASIRATLMNVGDIYFDSVAMFVLFLSATRYLEMRARHRSEDRTQALAQLLPETVIRVRDDETDVIPLDKLRVGDVTLIRPGDVIPADGRILSGELAVDEALLSGESLPVSREPGMDVFAGGINRAGIASVQITLTGASTSLAEIGRLLEQAKADRPPIALLADRIASKFVVGMLLVAAITGAVWLTIDPSRAFEIVLATLVVTCPCALSLATPAAIAASASRLARDGFLLIKSRVLEVLTKPVTLVFDKTGTLTEGRPTILETRVLTTSDARSADEYLALAAEIETASEHVLARAFSRHYKVGANRSGNIRSQQGAGVEAVVNGALYRIGSEQYVSELSGKAHLSEGKDADSTLVYLGDEHSILARFAIGDELRHDAEQTIRQLLHLGYSVAIASGDREAAVATVAKKLGIDRWHSHLSPSDKLNLVDELQQAGETVVMVGDGVNDAPVLAAADASVAIDAGTALARASADAVVLGKRLGSVVDAIVVAGKTKQIIRQNIAWAILYNITAVPLAAAGLLAPWMAAIGMSVSSLLVVLNALRLQSAKLAVNDSDRGNNATRVAQEALV